MLQFPPDDLLACSRFFFLTDEISAPADFILHRLLAQKYKASKGSKVIVLSTSSDLDRWKTLASKSNINLGQLATNGSFIFVDLLNEAVLPISEPFGNAITRSLRPLYDIVEAELSAADVDNQPLVILDDVSSLAWLGFSTLELSRFTRALWATCRKVRWIKHITSFLKSWYSITDSPTHRWYADITYSTPPNPSLFSRSSCSWHPIISKLGRWPADPAEQLAEKSACT